MNYSKAKRSSSSSEIDSENYINEEKIGKI